MIRGPFREGSLNDKKQTLKKSNPSSFFFQDLDDPFRGNGLRSV